MTLVHSTGSALQNHLLAERERIHASWAAPRHAISLPTKPIPAWLMSRLPRVSVQPEKPLKARVAEAMKMRGEVSGDKLRWIINAIYGSARDRGEYLVDESFRDIPPEIVSPGEPSVVAIQTIVAEYYNLTREELLSVKQCVRISLPRHIAMYLSKMLIPRSLDYIGKLFGSDHSAITHAVPKIERMIAANPAFAKEIEAMKKMVVS